jgi:hypothetical protein
MEETKTVVRKVRIAANESVFEQLFRAESRVATFSDATAEVAYVAHDEKLTREIVAIGRRLFDPSFAERHFYACDDWWPNHTRYVDASIDSFTQAYFDELHALLTGDYRKWRIQAVVFGDPLDSQTMIGSIAVEAERVLIDRALYGVLVWQRFDFRCSHDPEWCEGD